MLDLVPCETSVCLLHRISSDVWRGCSKSVVSRPLRFWTLFVSASDRGVSCLASDVWQCLPVSAATKSKSRALWPPLPLRFSVWPRVLFGTLYFGG